MESVEKGIGLFLCNCGQKLSGVLDFEGLAEYARKLPGVTLVVEGSDLCQEGGLQMLAETLGKGNVNSLVVCACSPKTCEPIFEDFLGKRGFKGVFEVVNIREQCAWSHASDPKRATDKAKVLIAGAVNKVRGAEGREFKSFEVKPQTLVVGGGVAGIRAALDVASRGFKVFLVERSPSLGGRVAQLGTIFPGGVYAKDFLLPLMEAVFGHPNVEVLTLSEVREVGGQPGHYVVKVLKKPRRVDEGLCNGCGECVEVCPVEVLNPFDGGLSRRKAVYKPFDYGLPSTYVIDEEACNRCGACLDRCPQGAVRIEDEPRELVLEVGSVILATGFEEYDPSEIKEFEYGVNRDVITQLQLARMLDDRGPTGGKVVVPSNGKKPRRVVMVMCVGARDVRNPFCSGICCTYALKHAIDLRKRGVEVVVCHMDIRTPYQLEEYYREALSRGVVFIRGRVSNVEKTSGSGETLVNVENTLTGTIMEIESDLVVLTSALLPQKGSDETSQIFGISLKPSKFYQSLYPKLRVTETRFKGIFICGSAYTPMDVSSALTYASAVAMDVVKFLREGRIEKALTTPRVDVELCDECKICVEACPFSALELEEVEKVRVNPLLCRGCGTCTAVCPTGAIQLRNFGREQIFSQIEGLTSAARELGNEREPIVVAFCCDECAYAAADLAGVCHLDYPPNVYMIRIPCAGRVSIIDIMKAFVEGADGVLVAGCPEKSCHFLHGSTEAEFMVEFSKEVLRELGLGGRLEMFTMLSSEPDKFVDAAKEMVRRVSELGPNPVKSGVEVKE